MLICLLLLFCEAHPSPPSMLCARKRAARREARLSKEAAKDVANASIPDTDEAVLESIGCKKSSRNPKHGRSSSSLQAHRNKYLKPGGAYDNGQRYWMKHTECITAGSAFPVDFLTFAKNAAMVVETVHEKRIRKYLSRDLEEYPNFDFLGLFTTIAVKEGSSERVHVDWGDNLHRYAFVFTAGDYIGGDFCVPQLGNRIAVPPGAVLAARTRLLAHCSTPAQGRRLVFTCFVDSMLFEQIFK
ncbi:hypothetical protein B0H10DRAFT_2194014 [Mycena sp. CBHHK59/15]|nr:hypothetical protein B0H10DRAFT_2194014 [Mycena sp. CBHHK59/15]